MMRQISPGSITSSSSDSNNTFPNNMDRKCIELNCKLDGSLLYNMSSCDRITCTEKCIIQCIDTLQFTSGGEGLLFTLGNVISLIGLAATFVTYCIFKELRISNHGKFLLHLIGSLFVAKLAFQVNPMFKNHQVPCSIVAIIQHYFCLAAFLWTNVISFHLWRDVRKAPADWTPHTINPHYILYVCYAWGIPFTVVVACSVLEFMETLKFHYGNGDHCGVLGDDALVYSLAIPLVLITSTNIIFFLCIIYKPQIRSRIFRWKRLGCRENSSEEVILYERSSAIMASMDQYGSTEPTTVNPGCLHRDTQRRRSRSSIVTSTLEPSRPRPSPREEALIVVHEALARLVWIFSKMSILMSFAWLSGFLAVITQTYQLWIIFVILNATQGVFIFFSFTIKDPALGNWKKMFIMIKKKVNRRSRYKKFQSRYTHSQPSQSNGSGTTSSAVEGYINEGQRAEEENAAVIVPSIAEITV